MAFIFDARSMDRSARLLAADPDTGETMTRSYLSGDGGGMFVCRYSQPEAPPIDFLVMSRTQSEATGDTGIAAAVCIDEPSLRQTYLRTYLRQGFISGFASGSPEEIVAGWEMFKQRVAEGVFAVSAFGGDYLKWSPNFHVEWANPLPDDFIIPLRKDTERTNEKPETTGNTPL